MARKLLGFSGYHLEGSLDRVRGFRQVLFLWAGLWFFPGFRSRVSSGWGGFRQDPEQALVFRQDADAVPADDFAEAGEAAFPVGCYVYHGVATFTVAEIHDMDLKAGLYIPWTVTYGPLGGTSENPENTFPVDAKVNASKNRKTMPFAIGRYSFVEVDARQFAQWGFDYLKYD